MLNIKSKASKLSSALIASLYLASSAHADPIQILDLQTTECINDAFNAVTMRSSYLSSPQYGELRETAPINDDFIAALSVHTQLDTISHNSVTHTFTAAVFWDAGNHYYHMHRQSVSASFNRQGELVRITEGGFSTGWNVSGYGSYTHALQAPDYADTQMEIIKQWVENASQTMTLFGLLCMADQVYEPSDGQPIRPPSDITVAELTWQP